MKVSFDGSTKIIQVTQAPAGGLVDIDVKIDVYSDWKEWVLLSDNSKYEPALRAVGGDPVSGTQNLGTTYFLTNGWRIRPYEANHRMKLTGNLYTDPAGDSPVISTVGSYSVIVEYAVSNIVDASSSLIYSSLYDGVVYYDDTSSYADATYPSGLRSTPVNNLAAALSLARQFNISKLHFHSDCIVPSGTVLSMYVVESHADYEHTITLQAGCLTDHTVFSNMRVAGVLGGKSTFHGCLLVNMSEMWGNIEDCLLEGSISFKAGSSIHVHMKDIRSHTQSPVTLSIGEAEANAINAFGMFTLQDKIGANEFNMHCGFGMITVDASCTGGPIYLAGNGMSVNNSNGATVIDMMASQADMQDGILGKRALDIAAKKERIYRRDGVTVLRQFDLGTTTDRIDTVISRTPE